MTWGIDSPPKRPFYLGINSQSSHLHFPTFQRKEIHLATLIKNASIALSPPSHSTQMATSLLSAVSSCELTHSSSSLSQSEMVPMELPVKIQRTIYLVSICVSSDEQGVCTQGLHHFWLLLFVLACWNKWLVCLLSFLLC